jgi:hypothetical protein
VEERHRRPEQSTDKKSTKAITYHVRDRFKLEGRKQLTTGVLFRGIEQIDQSKDRPESTEAVGYK